MAFPAAGAVCAATQLLLRGSCASQTVTLDHLSLQQIQHPERLPLMGFFFVLKAKCQLSPNSRQPEKARNSTSDLCLLTLSTWGTSREGTKVVATRPGAFFELKGCLPDEQCGTQPERSTVDMTTWVCHPSSEPSHCFDVLSTACTRLHEMGRYANSAGVCMLRGPAEGIRLRGHTTQRSADCCC